MTNTATKQHPLIQNVGKHAKSGTSSFGLLSDIQKMPGVARKQQGTNQPGNDHVIGMRNSRRGGIGRRTHRDRNSALLLKNKKGTVTKDAEEKDGGKHTRQRTKEDEDMDARLEECSKARLAQERQARRQEAKDRTAFSQMASVRSNLGSRNKNDSPPPHDMHAGPDVDEEEAEDDDIEDERGEEEEDEDEDEEDLQSHVNSADYRTPTSRRTLVQTDHRSRSFVAERSVTPGSNRGPTGMVVSQ